MSESDSDQPPPSQTQPKVTKKRGFAAMPREFVKEMARRGGRAAQASGRAHVFTSEEAKIAGRKGGASTHKKNRASKESAA